MRESIDKTTGGIILLGPVMIMEAIGNIALIRIKTSGCIEYTKVLRRSRLEATGFQGW